MSESDCKVPEDLFRERIRNLLSQTLSSKGVGKEKLVSILGFTQNEVDSVYGPDFCDLNLLVRIFWALGEEIDLSLTE